MSQGVWYGWSGMELKHCKRRHFNQPEEKNGGIDI